MIYVTFCSVVKVDAQLLISLLIFIHVFGSDLRSSWCQDFDLFFFIINNKKIFLERGKTSFTSNVNKRFFWRLQFQIQKIIWKYKKEEIYYFLKLNASRVENSSPSKWSKWFAWGKRDNISNETDSVLATHPLSSQEPDVSNGDVQGLNPHPPLNNVYRKEKQPLPTKSTSRTFDFYCQPLNPKQGEYWWSHRSFYRTM